ncbi:MAG: hypothetical protein P8009_03070 [Gammaproteobacteria bacterium]
MNPVLDSLRRWARLRRGWIALVLLAALGAKLLPVAALAAPGKTGPVAEMGAHACAEASMIDAARSPMAGAPAAAGGDEPAHGCCPDAAHLCAAHCAPLLLADLTLPMASPQPAGLLAAPVFEPTHHIHPPLLRPPRA